MVQQGENSVRASYHSPVLTEHGTIAGLTNSNAINSANAPDGQTANTGALIYAT